MAPSSHQRCSKALALLLLALTPSPAYLHRDVALHNFNTTESEPLGIIMTLGAGVSAAYAMYSAFKGTKQKENDEKRQADATAEVALFMSTQKGLCASVWSFLGSLFEAALLLTREGQGVHFQHDVDQEHAGQQLQDLENLKTFLAKAHDLSQEEGSPSPFGDASHINEIVEKVYSEGFTRKAAIELNLVIERWKGVQLGLGCRFQAKDTTFLEQLWRGPSAPSLLQKSEFKIVNPLDWIAIALFITVLHTDIFSVTDAFSSMGSAEAVYGGFTRLQVKNLQALACRLSYPMYRHTLRVKALEGAFLAVAFKQANLELPYPKDIDVCHNTPECKGYDMVCLSQNNCLRAIADMFEPGHACSRSPIDAKLTPSETEACLFDSRLTNKVSHESEGLNCKINNGKFYKFCGQDGDTDGAITTIVPTQCFSWETRWPEGVATNDHARRARPVAKYEDLNRQCSGQFKALEDVTHLVEDFQTQLKDCPE